MKKTTRRQLIWFVLALISIAILVVCIVILQRYRKSLTKDEKKTIYDQYYAMIVDDVKSDYWLSIYNSAYEHGLEHDVYVDLMGQNLHGDYSKLELMRIAIASKVDGIIVSADESEEMKALIDEAVANDIMVATIQGDNSQSSRCSYIGVGSYNLGREYGRQLLTLIDYHKNSIGGNGTLSEYQSDSQPVKYDVTMILDANTKDSVQNVLSTAIQETVAKQSNVNLSIDIVLVDESNAFAEEESIRDLFMKDNQPNVIICLSEQSTICAYQTVVDHNKVGEVDILGYYVSDEITNAIERGVIFSTISVDANQIGESAVSALMEYAQYGYTNQYVTTDIILVNKENVNEYIQKEENYEE